MMKRNLTRVILIALALICVMGSAFAETMRFGTVDGSSTVNLREEASSRSDRIGVYQKGTWMRIMGEHAGYYKVKMPDGKMGYMSQNYVSVTSAAMGTIGIVNNAGYLNLRKAATKNSQVLGQYDDGTPCILLGEKSGWYHVSVDGRVGYFDASYIRTKYMAYSPDVATVVSDNGGAVRMRTGPGTGYSSVKSISNGTYVMILQKGNDWWKVAADGKIGFMDTSYLRDGIIRQSGVTSGGSSNDDADQDDDNIFSGSGSAYVSNPGTNDKLNLRKTASKKSASLGKYSNGTKVTLLTTGSTWCRVKVNGKTGYMMTAYLSLNKPSNIPGSDDSWDDNDDADFSGSDYAYVNNPNSRDKLNLRKSASKRSSSLGKYSNGTKVVLLDTGAQWCKVRVDGKTGYMMTEFLTLKNTSGVPDMRVDHPDGTYVNLRKSATKSSSVLTRVPHGSSVTVLSPGKTWTKIRYRGYTGYMMTKYLDD